MRSYGSDHAKKATGVAQKSQQEKPSQHPIQAVFANPSMPLSASQVMQLQKSIGNRATAQLLQSREQSVQQANNTGLPADLKGGIEKLSGISMDDVKVHYNSPKPAQLQALAYAQGTDIHVAAGQELHLPHEAWHVVQQKKGQVQPTTQLQGVNINDDAGLEREADQMGARALQQSGAARRNQSVSFPS